MSNIGCDGYSTWTNCAASAAKLFANRRKGTVCGKLGNLERPLSRLHRGPASGSILNRARRCIGPDWSPVLAGVGF